jgi:hypothetical protein
MLENQQMLKQTDKWANKSLQATRDGRSSSAIAEVVISPARLSSGR